MGHATNRLSYDFNDDLLLSKLYRNRPVIVKELLKKFKLFFSSLSSEIHFQKLSKLGIVFPMVVQEPTIMHIPLCHKRERHPFHWEASI